TVYVSSLSKTGLLSDTKYEWEVRAFCDSSMIGVSDWENEDFETLEACSSPIDVVVSTYSMGIDNANLYWKGSNSVDHYLLIFRDIASPTWDTLSISGNTVTALTILGIGVGGTATSNGPNMNLNLTGLTGGTTYAWQVLSACSTGDLNNSSFVSGANFTTTQACIIPSGLNTTNIQLDRITMNWTATANAYHYDIRIRLQGGSWINLFNVYGTSKTKYVLSSGTTYEWQVRSVCSSDTSDVSAWTATQTVNTLTPCAKPQNTVVSSITSSQAMLGWDVGSAATSYDVRFKLQGSAWGAWQYTNGVTTNQLLQTSLSAGTYYHWQVRAVCGSSTNKSGWTSYNTFSTLSSNRITAGDTKLGENLNVYPNPTQGIFNISFISEKVDDFEITIVDAFGKLVSYEDKQDFIGEYTKKVDLSNWPRGIYMVQIKTQDSFVSKRIVLQ
ncbi:MAG: T9SS type A sorting domain-containing protein, partial [Flavobacteriales bacterium]|nr:T9SS type A sorting domain-containing protein [Flavobacteriales bacterium]